MRRQLFLFEPDLVDATCHQLRFAVSIARRAHADRWSPVAVVPRDVADGAVEQLEEAGAEVRRSFARARLRAAIEVRSLKHSARSADVAHVVASTMRRARAVDGAAFISGEPEFLPGLYAGLRIASWHGAPVAFHLFRWFDASSWRHPGRRGVEWAAREGARRGHRSGLLRLFGQTRPIAEYLAGTVDAPVQPAPFPLEWEATPTAAEIPRRHPPVVGFLGQARLEKGFSLFAACVDEIREPHQLDVLATRPYWVDTDEFAKRVEPLSGRSGSTVRHQPVSDEEYGRLLAGLDVVALPYDPTQHQHRTSNILMEAIGAGVVPVVPADTWLADVVSARDAGELFAPYESSALAAAIDRALQAIEPRRTALLSEVATWRAEHSADRFYEIVVGPLRASAPDSSAPAGS